MKNLEPGAWVLLLTLLVAQGALVAVCPPRPLGGDEVYYVSKAVHLVTYGALPRATAESLAAERGEGGNSDWRPPGYALVLAAISGGNFETGALRSRVATLQFLAMAAAILAAFATLRGTTRRRQFVAAAILGSAPWPFAFVTLIGPDSLCAPMAFFGALLLWRWTQSGKSRTLISGTLLLSTTLLLRPEMIAVAPVVVAAAVLLRSTSWRQFLVGAVVSASTFLLVVAAQYGYRTYFIGRPSLTLFGGLHIYNGGAFAWANSWIGTEHEAYDFVYSLSRGADAPLPDRAFSSEEERRTIEDLRAQIRERGFTREIDREFAEVAERRRAEHPFTAGVLPRLWHTAHLWLNTETNDQLLAAMRFMPRTVRRPILALLLALKLGLIAAFGRRLLQLVGGQWQEAPLGTILSSLVVSRTLLVGLALNWMVYRYMVVAWLPLIVAVCLPVRSVPPDPTAAG